MCRLLTELSLVLGWGPYFSGLLLSFGRGEDAGALCWGCRWLLPALAFWGPVGNGVWDQWLLVIYLIQSSCTKIRRFLGVHSGGMGASMSSASESRGMTAPWNWKMSFLVAFLSNLWRRYECREVGMHTFPIRKVSSGEHCCSH